MSEHSTTPPNNTTTTTTTTGGGGNTGLAFIVGILVVVVAVIAWFVFAGDTGTETSDVSVTIEGSGDSGAVEGGTNKIGEASQTLEPEAAAPAE